MMKNWPARADRLGGIALGALACLLLTAPWAAAQTLNAYAGKAMVVADRSARIDFRVAFAGTARPSVVVYYDKEDKGLETAAWGHNTGDVQHDDTKGRNEYSALLTDLEPETTYSYRVRATDPGGETWSELGQFTTTPPLPPWYETLAKVLGVLALLIVPFMVGIWLAARWRMPDHGWKIGVVICSLCSAAVVTYAKWPPSLGPDLSGGVILVYELEEPEEEEPGKEARPKKAAEEDEAEKTKVNMNDLAQAIALRVNPGGTREITIREYGDQIEVTIPRANEDEVKRIKQKIVSAGTLSFRILANERDHRDRIELARNTEGHRVFDREGKEVGWWVPVAKDREAEFEADPSVVQRVVSVQGKRRVEIFVVNDEYNVTGDYLDSCYPTVRDLENCVTFTFDSDGARRFGYLTQENEPDKVEGFYRKLGIILDGNLYSAPRLLSAIQGSGQITGNFTKESAKDLADVLNAGRLPAALKKEPISELLTGPTLGSDMIRRSSFALGLSIALVLAFMAVYYRFAGLVACGALLANVLLMLALMIVVKADFTLPGLAGFVLTVGMAVDANVLIFERMREELARDAALRMAIRNGFSRALSAIVDSNLTTIISSVILWWVGTTQIKGFAVVLILGVVMSMFTAVFCSRVVFDIAERRRWITKLSMMQMIGHTRIDFVRYMKPATVLSVVLVVIGLGAAFVRGKGLLDIDFTGGESVVILFKETQPISKVREDLADLRDLTVSDVQIEGEKKGLRFLINTSEEVDPDLPENEGLSAIEVVERHIHKVFGAALATNSLTVGKVTPIAAESVEKTPADAKPEASGTAETTDAKPEAAPATESAPEEKAPEKTVPPAETEPAKDAPAKADQSRVDLPANSLLASTDPAAVLLAQAEPADKATEEKSPEKMEPEEKKSPDAAEPTKTRSPFAGGVEAELAFEQPVDQESLQKRIDDLLAKASVSVPIELTRVIPAEDAKDTLDRWLLKTKLSEEMLRELVLEPLDGELRDAAYFPASSSIGGKVAGVMQIKALYALLGSTLTIILYLWIRFQRVMFGLAAVVAIVHDVLITFAALALSVYLAPVLGFLMVEQFKISLTVLAAFLTIMGYSLNDTIVIFDRIREIRGKSPHITADMINLSVNQTLSRTLLTFVTTFVVVLIMYVGGGQAIHAFAFAMLVGLVAGTYSTVFIAAPILLWMSKPATK
ncbi:MAG: protein translocase subunit SecD [Pirellulales bacterium]|nr:protein translocase subunit SecD [Pirellulales bacterium]